MFGHENPLGDICIWVRIDTPLLGRLGGTLTQTERGPIGEASEANGNRVVQWKRR
jgi:hypothetical protein